VPIQPFVWNDPTLKAKSMFALMGIQTITVPEGARPNLFNMVGDADASVGALKQVQALEREINHFRCFNRAANVLKTSREGLQKTLAGIPGCRLPRVSTCQATSYDELNSACAEFSAWPLIIRAAGFHGGENMCLLNKLSDLESIKDRPWLYAGVLLMEFIDCRNENKLYQKTRVIMIDGVPYPRHSIVSDNHFIHAKNRSDLMDQDDSLCRREEGLLVYLRDEGLIEYGEVFSAIYQRIGLDIFGIDYAMLGGELVIFEANACMDFLSQDYGANGRYRYLEPHVRVLRRAVKKMLMTA
jgi:hypothetical protein